MSDGSALSNHTIYDIFYFATASATQPPLRFYERKVPSWQEKTSRSGSDGALQVWMQPGSQHSYLTNWLLSELRLPGSRSATYGASRVFRWTCWQRMPQQ